MGDACEFLPPEMGTKHEGLEPDWKSLPSMPALLMELQQQLTSGKSDVRTIAATLQQDAGLVAQLLRLVNSGLFGLPNQVVSVKKAIAYLGFSEVRNVVISVAVVNSLMGDDREAIRQFWRHSYHTALIAKVLAMRARERIAADTLWSAALLHDIGLLVCGRLYPNHARALQERTHAEGCLVRQAEADLGLYAHGELGARLCREWNLPQVVEQVCQHHEDDVFAEPQCGEEAAPLVRIIRTAENLSHLAVRERYTDETRSRLRDEVMALLDLDNEGFEALTTDLADLSDEAERFMEQAMG